jgi:mannose-6-phosphate isomerase-like protein (cupin superfamily)
LADPTPDEAPPPHVHHGEDETFYVLDGVLRFVIGTEEFEAEPGALVHAPRGVPHRFTVATPTARILALVTPRAASSTSSRRSPTPPTPTT